MAEANFFVRIFGLSGSDYKVEKEDRSENVEESNPPESTTGTTLQDAVNFVAELQSYYYNDICKMQADLAVQTSLSRSRINFINKKIKQDQVALSQIDEILKFVQENEREYQAVWRKSVYSFYDEIEDAKLATVQAKVYEILVKLCAINTKPELDKIISNRIEKYRVAWNITEELLVPKNYNVVLTDEVDGIEEHRFGEFRKKVYASNVDKVLTSEQLDKIREITFEFEDEIPTNQVWVYASSVTRFQLNFMRRTCIIENNWEYSPDTEGKLCFDIIKLKDLEQYLKGILQIILTKGTYAVISIVIPTGDMLRAVGETNRDEEKAEICKKYRFYLKERSGLYGGNFLTARVDRRNIPEIIKFVSYPEFKKCYF